MPAEYFFDKQGLLQNRLMGRSRISLFLDYDGTLVPLRREPSKCFLREDVKKRLMELAGKDHLALIILTGRSLHDIREKVGISLAYYGGNHGLDICGPGLRYTHPKAIFSMNAIGRLKRLLSKGIEDIEGAWVEDKKLTLSLHLRNAGRAGSAAAKRSFYDAVTKSGEGSFSVIKGKQVLELVPDAGWNKGAAARLIMKEIGVGSLPIYIGDDLADESAFEALGEAGITIRVGKSKKTSAGFYVNGWREVHRLISGLSCALNKG